MIHQIGYVSNPQVNESVQLVFTTGELVNVIFMYLGPVCFQLASTSRQAYQLMMENPHLEKYRIARDALQQCLSLKTRRINIWSMTPKMRLEREMRASLTVYLAAFDPNAALKRADSNPDLVYRVYDLVLVSDTFASFDKGRAKEILEHMYNEVSSLPEGTKSFSKDIFFNEKSAALARLAVGFIQHDLEKAKQIYEEVEVKFDNVDLREVPEGSRLDLYLFQKFNLAMLDYDDKKILGYISYISNIDLKQANEIAETYRRFLTQKICKVTLHRRWICSLLDLSKVMFAFNKTGACELAQKVALHNKFIESTNEFGFYIQYIDILVKTGVIDKHTATLKTIELKETIQKNGQHVGLLILSKKIAFFNGELAKEMALEAIQVIGLEKIPNPTITNLILSEVLAPYEVKLSLEKLSNSLAQFDGDKEHLVEIIRTIEAIAKVIPTQVKEVISNLKKTSLKRIAFTAFLEGILAESST